MAQSLSTGNITTMTAQGPVVHTLAGNKTSRYDYNSILFKLRHFDTDMQNNRDMSITCPRQVDTRFFNKIYSKTDLIFPRPK